MPEEITQRAAHVDIRYGIPHHYVVIFREPNTGTCDLAPGQRYCCASAHGKAIGVCQHFRYGGAVIKDGYTITVVGCAAKEN